MTQEFLVYSNDEPLSSFIVSSTKEDVYFEVVTEQFGLIQLDNDTLKDENDDTIYHNKPKEIIESFGYTIYSDEEWDSVIENTVHGKTYKG